MSKWLIIGASSFTGSHFCKLLKFKRETFDMGGLRNLHWLGSVDADTCVVNFAAVNVVAPSWDKPGKYMKVNVGRVTEAVQSMVGECKPKRYVHISTPEVYGSTDAVVREDYHFNPSTPYAVSRASAEWMLQCYQRQYGLPVVFTRSCNVYGPGQQHYRLIPKLIVSIKKGMKLPLEGGGTSLRAFLHVSDACEAIYKVATDGTDGEAYNISAPVHSIMNIVRIVCNVMDVDPEQVIELAPERPGKDACYLLNDTKIRAMGWKDTIPLAKGIAQTADWITANWETVKDWPMEYQG